MRFRARKCRAADCGMRFPVESGSPLGERCPICGAATDWIDAEYETATVDDRAEVPTGPELEVLVDNVRSLRNVGAIVRTCDGVGVSQLHVCGFTPTPDHPRMDKTSLGAERSVAWTQHRDATVAVEDALGRGLRVWALEGGPRSENLFTTVGTITDAPPVLLIVGHEVSGVDPRLLARADRIVHLPMLGVKGSLNVAVALGVAAYAIRFGPRGA